VAGLGKRKVDSSPKSSPNPSFVDNLLASFIGHETMTADDKRWHKAERLKVLRVGTTATYRVHGHEWTAGTKAE
jgi:hypothetical protein